jgi:nucleotide-binding universal stress UspA family protein
MYNKILVPLDGSELAECSLEHVMKMASAGGVSEVVLLRVVELVSPYDALPWVQANYTITDIQNRRRDEARDYLKAAAGRLIKAGVPVRVEVVDGRAAETIVDYAREHQMDLIVISSHGRSGIARWALGSVADRVLRHSSVPTLLISAPGCRVQNQEVVAPPQKSRGD